MIFSYVPKDANERELFLNQFVTLFVTPNKNNGSNADKTGIAG